MAISVNRVLSNIAICVRLRSAYRSYTSSSFPAVFKTSNVFNGTVERMKFRHNSIQFIHRSGVHLFKRPVGCATINEQKRNVVTLSPLGVAFNTKPERGLFQSLKGRNNVGLFRIPELTDYTGFYLLLEKVRLRTEELVNEASDAQRKRAIVNVFDELSDCLCRVADMADFARTAHPDQKFSQVFGYLYLYCSYFGFLYICIQDY